VGLHPENQTSRVACAKRCCKRRRAAIDLTRSPSWRARCTNPGKDLRHAIQIQTQQGTLRHIRPGEAHARKRLVIQERIIVVAISAAPFLHNEPCSPAGPRNKRAPSTEAWRNVRARATGARLGATATKTLSSRGTLTGWLSSSALRSLEPSSGPGPIRQYYNAWVRGSPVSDPEKGV
jgi:hypothetical protein